MARPRSSLSKNASPEEIREELAFLRQQYNSMILRGHYVECAKSIEEQMGLLYALERWPENFFSILRIHQKCYPSLGRDQVYPEYLLGLLKKNSVPVVFSELVLKPDSAITWNVEYFRSLSLQFRQSGNMEYALSCLDIAAKIEPGSAGIYLDKSGLLEGMGREKDALEMIERSLELNPGNRQALNTLTRHYISHDPKKALELVEEAIAAVPDEAANYGIKGEILQNMGDKDGAMAAYEKAIELDPYNAEYPYRKGELLYTTGSKVLAVPQFRLAVALDEKHIPSLMRLSELSTDHQPELALNYLGTVVTLEPKNKEACMRRAKLLRATGKMDAAIRQYRVLLDLDPGADVYAGLGELYLHGGRPDRALEQMDKALELDPANVPCRLLKAQAHLALEDEGSAMEEYRTCTTLDAGNAKAWGELGQLLMQASPQEALDCLNKALRYAPDNAFYHASKGELLLKIPGRRTEAVESLHKASKLDPGNAELHVKLGKLLEADSNFASAMDHYQKALSLHFEDAEAHFLLARILMDTRPDQALVHVNHAIRLSVIRGEYYYLKARIIASLEQDKIALEQLQYTRINDENQDFLRELREQGGLRVALMYIDRAIELDADNPVFLCFRARLFFQLGQKPKAKLEYQRLLEKSPDQHEALFGMALILSEKKGEEKRVREYFDKAIDLAPAVAEYHAEKARFLAKDPDRYGEALEAFTAAININNQLWQVIFDKARLCDAHGNLAGAVAEYRRVLLLRPDAADASARMAELLCDLRPAFALAYIDQAVKLEPDRFLHRAWRAAILAVMGEEAQALEELHRAVSLGDDTAETHYAIAGVLASRLPAAAIHHCREAIQRDGEKAACHLLCGNLLLEQNDPAALDCFRRVVELESGNHEAREQITHIACMTGAPDALEQVEAALEQKPDCPVCLYWKACILDEVQGDAAAALEAVELALRADPASIPCQEKLVELLGKKRSLLRLALERRKLEKLRKKTAAALEIQEPPVFGEDGPEEIGAADRDAEGEEE